MKLTLTLLQLVIGLAVTILILIQAKGTGLGRTFGAQMYHSKRGVENLVFKSTIYLSAVFVLTAVIAQILS
ncbi:preprotein translocase subunit SecG [Candidatus Amesbacteria bacterium RIFCSPLOWO2_02_FULL_48_11]|uniref:Protein-export membrane protein SecG n=2 Tax=Candidatus Amesiibacteriota TaxID=1752730 RepID=A0A0G1TQM7_9BACT|nr:MAG: hypothetical protein UX78_C0007G0004 [Candidatus Amesbacteria bacterium GW2011_GWA2_47_11]KKU99863.1 MAG: hypothetical protein UY33_C0020G0003 [Candidatus Amesbacteria bacterium GW2011_GWA1_48_9]OGD05555.1 MAG: preprotein translocase subunit SecG [Candidatus Amesbacteria bacterium RIFCSPLOWO2_02_FULL_48_11]OGD07939.1 MAG: preprotein translocase subunit SecG [Candidatus Amesbacteria bacterium RIFCSPLOWO2_01_FULL_48_50]